MGRARGGEVEYEAGGEEGRAGEVTREGEGGGEVDCLFAGRTVGGAEEVSGGVVGASVVGGAGDGGFAQGVRDRTGEEKGDA